VGTLSVVSPGLNVNRDSRIIHRSVSRQSSVVSCQCQLSELKRDMGFSLNLLCFVIRLHGIERCEPFVIFALLTLKIAQFREDFLPVPPGQFPGCK